MKEAAGLDMNGSEDMDTFSMMAARTHVIKIWWEATTVSNITSAGIAAMRWVIFPRNF